MKLPSSGPLTKNSALASLAFLSSLAATGKEAPLPLSDPDNAGGWILNTEISDEFNAPALDEKKWFVQGKNGGFHKWKGRAPSQFAPHNVKVADGHLLLTSAWEPDYDFAKEEFDGRAYENITTAAVISQKKFLYGYMETRSKAGNAAMTSSFWTLGYQSELDMFEQMGRPKHPDPNRPAKKGFDSAYMFSIHDWRPNIIKGKNRIFNHTHQLPFRVADDFHVYGCEWGVDYLKFFIDGKLVHTKTQKELDDAWILTNPLEIWFDSETFPWFGTPSSDELPVDFKVDYVRIWQKPDPNLLDRAFHGFEGPTLLKHVPLPEDENTHHKFWYIPNEAKSHFSITDEKHFNGRKSLKFVHDGKPAKDQISAFAPNGTAKLGAGDHILRFRIWVDRTNTLTKLCPILEKPWLEIKPIELEGIPFRQWVEIEQPFTRDEPSGDLDRIRFAVNASDIPGGKSTLYIDDVSIEAATNK